MVAAREVKNTDDVAVQRGANIASLLASSIDAARC